MENALFLLFQVRVAPIVNKMTEVASWLGLVQWRCNNCAGKKEWFDLVEGVKKVREAKVTTVQTAKKGNDK